jgi:hypothetical protein
MSAERDSVPDDDVESGMGEEKVSPTTSSATNDGGRQAAVARFEGSESGVSSMAWINIEDDKSGHGSRQ